MKRMLCRLGLLILFLWLFLCLCPPVLLFLLPAEKAEPAPSSSPCAPSAVPVPQTKNGFRILNRASGTVLTVSEAEFLPLALLCELSPDAPAEALKAQAVAIRTRYRYASEHPETENYDFVCDTDLREVYAPAEIFAELHGAKWPDILNRMKSICRDTDKMTLRYAEELLPLPYFALSAGCTRTMPDTPWLSAVCCPGDLLYADGKATAPFSAEEIKAAFAGADFPEDPVQWFSEPVCDAAGYVESILFCGKTYTGAEMQEKLSLRSPAFSIAWDNTQFQITTRGWGHGYGMSQGAAIDMAAAGADFETILRRFYPGTALCTD